MIGYSVLVQRRNAEADDASAGVRLGRVCIKLDIPVSEVAAQFGVSRQTVYDWFDGTYRPSASVVSDIEAYLSFL
jgi:DNA-binding XRE family transcriptional regulator